MKNHDDVFREMFDKDIWDLAIKGIDPPGWDDIPEWTAAANQTAILKEIINTMKSGLA